MKVRFTSLTSCALFIAILAGLLVVTKFVSSRAQEASQEKRNWKVIKVGPKRIKAEKHDPRNASDGIIEDLISPALPIKVAIKNLKTDSLLRDIEIEVTNTANRSIYFLQLSIVLPENLSEYGYPTGFPLRYGRPELMKLENPLKPEDVPLLPGESVILRIAETNLAGFEGFVAKGVTKANVSRVYLVFVHLNFGDQTGFSGTGAEGTPRALKENP